MSSSPAFDVKTEISGKACLITGASRTLGAVIARRMARYGAHIALNYHHSREAALALSEELAAQGVKALPIRADVTQPDQVERLVAETQTHLGPIDILVNNVGPYTDAPFLKLSLADFERVLAGNVRATFLVSQAVGRRMKAQGHGHIINIAATDIFHRSHSVYGLAKQGVIYLTEAMALELAPEVHLNAIAPDLIADNEDMRPELVTQSIAGTPMGRLVTRAEVADMVYLLCTSLFDSLTGQTIVMDGGRSIPRIAMG